MHLKTDKVDKKTSQSENFFLRFFQSPHQVDMKNVIECPREFFAYFNDLETTCDLISEIKGTSNGCHPYMKQNSL